MRNRKGKTTDQRKPNKESSDRNFIFIKKYGNRRFYSSQKKKYITLSDIQQLIAQGSRIKVVDAETEADITSDILTQILLEQGRAIYFPVDLLEQLIRTNEKSLSSIWAPLLAQQFKVISSLSELTLAGLKNFIHPTNKFKE